MDSMMGVEIKQTLEREFEVFLTPQDIRSLTFAKLYEIAAASETEDKTEKAGTVLSRKVIGVGPRAVKRDRV